MNIDIAEEIQTTVVSVLGQLQNDADIFRYLKVIIENVELENLKGNEKKDLAIRILEDIIQKLENMMQDYKNLIGYVGNIDLYKYKKQEFLSLYFNKCNNAKEWYYKLIDLDYCFTPNQIVKFADLFQQLQTGDIYTFMSSDSEIRQLQCGCHCKYEKRDCAKGDTCRDHSIKHRIDYVHECGPVWVLYISQLINNLIPKRSNKRRRRGGRTRKRLYYKSRKYKKCRSIKKRKQKNKKEKN